MVYRISLSEWLDFFGFSASPFSRWEAAEEAQLSPERLSAQLVKPACFDRVLGQASEPKTVVLFAPRGAGKTACRILVDYYCRQGMGQGDRAETGGKVLPILHTHLDEAVRQSKDMDGFIDEYWHTCEILERGVQSLVEALRSDVDLVERVKGLAAARRLDLQWFFNTYPPLSAADLAFLDDCLEFNSLDFSVREPGFRGDSQADQRVSPRLVQSLERREQASPIDQLGLFVDLVCANEPTQGLGYQAVYVLVDGLDEFFYSADLDTLHGANLIIPLLANLRLMDSTPRLAFKFFLPAEMAPTIRQCSAIRHDRLGYEAIAWANVDMLEILHRRLTMYQSAYEGEKADAFHILGGKPSGEDLTRRHRVYEMSFDVLCAPELRGLEDDIVRVAAGNPRRMLRLCEYLLQVHLDRPLERSAEEMGEVAYLFTKADWKDAQTRLMQESSHLPQGVDLEGISEALLEAVATAAVSPVVIGAEEAASAVSTRAEQPLRPEHLQDYPAPIALTYLDYLRRQDPFEQLGRLLDLFEVTVALVGSILLAQLVVLAGDAAADKLGGARLRLKRMSLGAWLAVWERVPGICNALGASFYARHLQRFFERERERLHALRVMRNEVWGHGVTGDEQTALDAISRYAPDVEQVIASLDFLATTRLVQVKKMRMEEGQFDHLARIYVGDNPNFPWEHTVLSKPLECDKLLLLRETDVLLLYPLLVATTCPQCQHEEIFTYQQIEDSQVQYLSYSSGHRLYTGQYVQDIQSIVGT